MFIISINSNYGDGTSSSVQALRSTTEKVAEWIKSNYPDLDGSIENGETDIRIDDWVYIQIEEMEVDE